MGSAAHNIFGRLDSLLGSLDHQGHTSLPSGEILPLDRWCTETPIILDGIPFTFERHEYLRTPYTDNHPNITEQKAGQMGLSTKAILKVLHGAIHENMKGVLYLFPTKSDMGEFCQGRFDPIIADNPDSIANRITENDSKSMKTIRKCVLYMRGMQVSIALKCHDDQTEVLTHKGWKFFKDVTLENEFATRSPTGDFMWQSPTHIHRNKYSGPMLQFQAHGLDFNVTPTHRLLLTTDKLQKTREWFELAYKSHNPTNSNFVVLTTKSWSGKFPDFVIKTSDNWNRVVVPGNYRSYRWKRLGKHKDRVVNLRDFVAFLGIYVAEGSCNGVKNGVMTGGRVSVSQNETSQHFQAIKQLLERMPFDWRYSSKSFRVGDIELAKILFPLGDKYTKHLPDWVLDLPKRYLEVLWKFAVMGDGHIDKRNGHTTYATVSKRLADQFQEILQKMGFSASILVQTPPKGSVFKDGRPVCATTTLYLVSVRKSTKATVPKPEYVDYEGEVFCASVPNGTLLTRRNGYALWSGNSIPVDFIVFDELDEAPEDKIELADERMSHSLIKRKLKLSNPSTPDYGINKEWQLTDQRHWLLKCPKCGKYTCLEDTFPKCLIKVKDRVIRACQNGKCHAELNPADGEWVAKRPSITDARGYQYSQLFSQFVSPEEIFNKFRTTTNLPVFWNMKIGLPYIEAENRLSAEEVLKLCSKEGMATHEVVPCYMGVDQGKGLHVVLGKRHWDKLGQVIHIGQYKDFEELDSLMTNFHVSQCVIDSQPETRKAREFAERFPGRVFLNTYNRYHKGSYLWNDEQMTVTCNRTESLDASHYTVTRGQMIFPRRTSEMETFAAQLHNVGKRLEENKEGSKVYVYRRLGEDHYRHSYNYFVMALQHGASSFFSAADLS